MMNQALYFAFIVWLSVSLGALSQLMLHHLTGGRWGFIVRRLLEAALVPLPVLAVLWIIVLWGRPELWRGEGYFAPGWLIARGIVCFAIWIALAGMLVLWSQQQDGRADFQLARKLRVISGPGLVLYFLTIGFAMLDWLMELEPGWRSTMFPVIMISTQTLMALSGATLAAVFLLPKREREIRELATTQGWHDLGKLLFAFVIFWAYVAFAQLLIIWCGNLPSESVWYLRRNSGGWEWMARVIAVVCFFAPAAVLLAQPPKRHRPTLALVSLEIGLAQVVYLYWVVAPAFSPVFHLSWMDPVILLAVGLIWGALFWIGWSTATPIPRNDPRLAELETSHER